MIFKDPSQIIDKRFQMEAPDGSLFWIPAQGEATTLSDLVSACTEQCRAFDRQGTAYTIPLTRQAAELGMNLRQFLTKAIEHQICTRHPERCYDDGLGDKLHKVSINVDKAISKMPKALQGAAQLAVKAATKAATGKSSTTLSGCSVCGGSKAITPKASVLGRAGKLNQLGK